MKTIFTFLLSFISFVALSQDRIYPLDGNANEILNGLNGTMGTGINQPTPTTDRFNRDSSALYFNGDDFINLPITGMTAPTYTVSAWLSYPNVLNNVRMWFTVGNHSTTDQWFGMGASLAFNGIACSGYRIGMNYFGVASNGQPTPNQWYHVICIYDTNYVSMYVNGQLINIDSNYNALPDYGSNPTALIGSRSINLSGWIGSIDDLHYYDHALTTFQIDSMFASGSNKVTGTCFIDLNGNAVKDSNETYATGIEVMSVSDSTQSFSCITNSSGSFTTIVDTGNVITNPIVPSYHVLPGSFNSQHSGYGNTDTVMFALTPISGITDGSISLVPVTSAVPGFNARYDLVLYNNGTDTLSGTIMLIMPPYLAYISSVPAADSLVVNTLLGDTLFWNISGLAPLQSSIINLEVYLAPPPVFNLADTLNFYVSLDVTSLPFDTYTENNFAYVRQAVVASHDPNDKTVLEGNSITSAQISAGNYLTYVIRFQNSGNMAARIVSVLDTLSSNLDWNTFEMIHSSHAYNVSRQNGNILRWDFPNIFLADSATDPEGSQGFVSYRIKPKTNLSIGSVVENTANVYFDFNLPVVTNTTRTTVNAAVLSTSHLVKQSNQLFLYPNPVSDNLMIDGANLNGIVSIYNSLGEKMKEFKIVNEKTEFNVSAFSKGIYYISYLDGKITLNNKFIKE